MFKTTEHTVRKIFSSREFKRLFLETADYRDWLENEWEKNEKIIFENLKDITGLDMPKITITVFVTHPKLSNGKNLPKEKNICWGHPEDWENYSLVYLSHELLHIVTYRKYANENLMHAIIELCADNELRLRLNKRGDYFQEKNLTVGHPALQKLEKKILPFWKKYLRCKLKEKNIFEFAKLMNRNIK